MRNLSGWWERGRKAFRTIYIVEGEGQRGLDRLAVAFSLLFLVSAAAFVYFTSQALRPSVPPPATSVAQNALPIVRNGQPGASPEASQVVPVESSAPVATTPAEAPSPTQTGQSAQATAYPPIGEGASPTAASTTLPETAYPAPGSTNTPTTAPAAATPTQAGQGGATQAATLTITPTGTQAATPQAQTRQADSMRMLPVPAGTFTMGSDESVDADAWYGELPAHEVFLDTFFIDETEVTNAMYALCVSSGSCTPPELNSSVTRDPYFDNAQYARHPVIFVNFEQAGAYCRWAGARLPTEAEWEKAARGTDRRLYPWGNSIACDLANFEGCQADTTPVGSYPNGKSPYGALDMAGNVYEWVSDWMDEGYYSASPRNNPTGPSTGIFRVLRSGSWFTPATDVRAAARGLLSPEFTDALTGFRCAKNP